MQWFENNGKVDSVRVDMGVPQLLSTDFSTLVPVSQTEEAVFKHKVDLSLFGPPEWWVKAQV